MDEESGGVILLFDERRGGFAVRAALCGQGGLTASIRSLKRRSAGLRRLRTQLARP